MTSKVKYFLVTFCIFVSSSTSALQQGTSSDLWGKKGELWSPYNRLPDFSHAGLTSIKDNAVIEKKLVNVTDFGAVGDGITDSTEVFNAAISSLENGVVFIPEGRYLITDVITISKSNIELRGAGPEKTILVFPYSLRDIKGAANIKPSGYSSYSFSGAFLQVKGQQYSQFITKINKNSQRGDNSLFVVNSAKFEIGQFVRLTMGNSAALGHYLHDGEDLGEMTRKEKSNLVDTVVKIVGIEDNLIIIDRPLRTDVKVEWGAKVSTFEPTVSNVSIANIAIEFPNKKKKPHLYEDGFNGILLENIAESWIENIKITNADNAVSIVGVRFCEIEDVVLNSDIGQEITGHHGVWVKSATQGCLVNNFTINTKFEHDLSVEGLAHGNVFKNGLGLAINFDHHRNAPYENLFSNIDVGDPKRIWRSSGKKARGPHSAVRTTFWNLKFQGKRLPKIPDWPQLNYIGLSNEPDRKLKRGRWIENTKWLFPEELHQAQSNIKSSK